MDEWYSAMKKSVLGPLVSRSEFVYLDDVVCEAHSHLSNFRRLIGALGMAQAIKQSNFDHLWQIKNSLASAAVSADMGVIGSKTYQCKNQPIIVTGRSGSGKSTLLAQIFTYAPEWLTEKNNPEKVIRIVRQCGQSPNSNFASELLRSLCIQISLTYGLESHLNRSVAAHELSELASCFQELLKLGIDGNGNPKFNLLVILDDLHHLQSALQYNAILGWMPWNLSNNVHLICSVALESESVLNVLKSRINAENFVSLDDCAKEFDEHQFNQKYLESIFSMMQSKLRDEKRNLTEDQWDFVHRKLNDYNRISSIDFRSKMTPLFATMLSDSILSCWESFFFPKQLPLTVEQIVTVILDDLEECAPVQLVQKICSYLTCTKYGLRETEIFNLVEETFVCQIWANDFKATQFRNQRKHLDSNHSKPKSTNVSKQFKTNSTTSIWIILKSKLRHLLKEYYLQGRLYLHWKSASIVLAIQNRYLADPKQIKATHSELAVAFLHLFNELHTSCRDTELIREVDELWHHLLKSDNLSDLKSLALMNIRFLNVIVQSVSVCYLRCVLDAIRSRILDWDIEQLYSMLKQSVHVVTQDAYQLPVEILSWLAAFVAPATLSLSHLSEKIDSHPKKQRTSSSSQSFSKIQSSNFLFDLLQQCYAKIQENSSRPMLYPLNIWLNLPVPPQLTMITTPWNSITRAVSTSNSQHLIVCEGRIIHFFHLATKSLVKSFEGHESTVTCLSLSISDRWLATGAEDNSVHIWQIEMISSEIYECFLCHKFHHHSAGVLCVTINHQESIVLSGSENGSICVVNLLNGTLLSRLEHHKSMVTCLCINSGDDVLVSGSTDRTVVIWNLENFCILNEILLMRPVLHMDISLDSTFLLLSLDDNSLHLRALTTGTEIHSLQPTTTGTLSSVTSVVSYVRFAQDNCRCVIGYAEGRIVVFDIHSARQLQVLSGHTEMITSILPQKNDHFLITTGGNKIIVWNFYPVKRVEQIGTSGEIIIDNKSLNDNNDPFQMIPNNISTNNNLIPDTINQEMPCNITNSITKDLKELSSSKNARASDRKKNKNATFLSTQGSSRKKTSISSMGNHVEPITCVCISRDGHYAASGSKDRSVKIWLTSSAENYITLDSGKATITCIDIASNSQFIVFGTEDGLLKSWSITLSMYLSDFIEHAPYSLTIVKVLSDNKKVLSADINSVIRIWAAETAVQLMSILNKPTMNLFVHGGTCFGISGKFNNCLKYWRIFEPENEKSVSHSDSITCFICTYSNKTLITGSQDMSLKIWETSTGKLTQVLVGHEGGISCVATAALNETVVVSGSQDCNIIVWDINTGAELLSLTGHNANVIGIVLTPDGSRALSYSEDNTFQLWDIKDNGKRLSLLDMHQNIIQAYCSLTVSYVAVWLGCNSHILPIIKHHNNCAENINVDLPVISTPEKSSAWIQGLLNSRGSTRVLKREQSFDSFYFEHMLHRGQSFDDFRKIGLGQTSTLASPFGSRENLWPTSHDENKGMSLQKGKIISKLKSISSKQKILKKQQSMFACFPEFTTKTPISSANNSIHKTSDSSSLSQQINGSLTFNSMNEKINSSIHTPTKKLSALPLNVSQEKDEPDDSRYESILVKSKISNDFPAPINSVSETSICSTI
ncbi:hypothetical protein NH340_JMT00011 [Sarcoptes scabiei]|nr:hypothetical protein NH340_JMT00011 [Sarcoptes scabiei]